MSWSFLFAERVMRGIEIELHPSLLRQDIANLDYRPIATYAFTFV
jgi:hypothetical protein